MQRSTTFIIAVSSLMTPFSTSLGFSAIRLLPRNINNAGKFILEFIECPRFVVRHVSTVGLAVGDSSTLPTKTSVSTYLLLIAGRKKTEEGRIEINAPILVAWKML